MFMFRAPVIHSQRYYYPFYFLCFIFCTRLYGVYDSFFPARPVFSFALCMLRLSHRLCFFCRCFFMLHYFVSFHVCLPTRMRVNEGKKRFKIRKTLFLGVNLHIPA